jgi:hypothetical protein
MCSTKTSLFPPTTLVSLTYRGINEDRKVITNYRSFLYAATTKHHFGLIIEGLMALQTQHPLGVIIEQT